MKPTTTLYDDTRGAIMLLGVVMGALLVGALWHVASIGDAIIWREQAQSAAYAAAFENAVWHARGMNVIVAINIVMSLVMAVLVIWRTVLLLATLALVLSTLLCVFTAGIGCGFTAAVGRLEIWMVSRDTQVATNIVRVLAGMSAAESAVASATPVVAFFQAPSNTSGNYTVTAAASQSASLLPSFNDKGAQKLIDCIKGFKGGKVTKTKPSGKAAQAYGKYLDFVNQPRIGFGVSLPVQQEADSLLCQKAGEAVLNNLAGVLESMHVPSAAIDGIDKVKGVLGAVTGSLPGLFCSPIGATHPAEITNLVGEAGKQACGNELEERRVFVGGGETEIMYRDDDGKLQNEEDFRKECEKDKKDKANEKLSSNAKSSYEFAECGTPAKVWEWAVNGNLFMRSFSQIEKATPMATRDDTGLEVADHGVTGNLQAFEAEQINAHAEMYLDCADRWINCKSNAMWQLRWKARLRRVQPAENLLSSAIEPALVSTLTQVLSENAGKAGDKLVDRTGAATFGIPKLLVPKIKDTYLFRHVKNKVVMNGLYKTEAFDSVGSFLIANASGDGTVH